MYSLTPTGANRHKLDWNRYQARLEQVKRDLNELEPVYRVQKWIKPGTWVIGGKPHLKHRGWRRGHDNSPFFSSDADNGLH